MFYLFYIFLFIVIMLLYFKVADYYNIIDRPNERSSHTEVTIRGGGIILLFAALTAVVLHPEYWLPVTGMLVIGIISFIDDRITLSSRIRIIFHLAAVTLLFSFLSVFNLFPWWIVLAFYIIVIGIINAYNFMDGINGITGAYSLVVLSGLQYVNYYQHNFIAPDLIWLPLLAVLVFLYFNFRKKAKCFAGDVGSITIAFWVIFLMLKLIMLTGNYAYILFLAVYGVDTILTILHRLVLKQNIFDAHRLHFYQILSNDLKWPHLSVSILYASVQLGIIVVVTFSKLDFTTLFLAIITPLAVTYIWIKPLIVVETE